MIAAVAGVALLAGCGEEPSEDAGDESGESADQQEHAESMAREHEGDRPVGTSLVEDPPVGLIQEQRVAYASVDGTEVHGFLAEPADATGDEPGVIVIHEWWGLNDNIEKMTRKLAAQGYQALAVDLYRGMVASEPGRARELMEATFERTDQLESNLRQATSYLREERAAPRIGVIGWCFGGGWSLRTGLMLGDGLDAVVVYYGRLVTDPDRLKTLEAPLLGIFGEQDQGIPVETVRDFEAELRALDKTHRIEIYPGAGHAFANPSGTRFEPEAAEAAWDLTLTFLGKHLRP
jgi:carboxymethylenebutenolidase